MNKYKENLRDYLHELSILYKIVIPDNIYVLKDILVDKILHDEITIFTPCAMIPLLYNIGYSQGAVDALSEYKKTKKRRKKMKKNIKRTLDVIKLTSPSGDIKYLPGNTTLKTIMDDYPLWTMESCIIKASMPEEEFIQKATVKEVDNEEE